MIRTAEPDDWPALEGLLRAFHAENALASLNMEKAKAVVMRAIEHDLVILAERDGRLIGGMGLIEDDFWFSDEHLLRDVFTYVVPEERGGDTLNELKKVAEGIAEAFSVPCFITVLNPERAGRRGRIGTLSGWASAGYLIRLSHRISAGEA